MIPFKHVVVPPIPEEELTPTVRLLLTIIEQQQAALQQQQARIEALEAEVARLKKLPKNRRSAPVHCPKMTMSRSMTTRMTRIPDQAETTQPANRASAKRS